MTRRFVWKLGSDLIKKNQGKSFQFQSKMITVSFRICVSNAREVRQFRGAQVRTFEN